MVEASKSYPISKMCMQMLDLQGSHKNRHYSSLNGTQDQLAEQRLRYGRRRGWAERMGVEVIALPWGRLGGDQDGSRQTARA